VETPKVFLGEKFDFEQVKRNADVWERDTRRVLGLVVSEVRLSG
jgi:hypothetical protein